MNRLLFGPLLIALLLTAPATAASPPRDRGSALAPSAASDRDIARDRIRTRLHFARLRVEQHERALEMLEEGAGLDEVRAILEASPDRDAADPSPEQIMAVLADVNPPIHGWLERKRTEGREEFHRAIERAASHVAPLVQLRETDPEEYQRRAARLRNHREIRAVAFRIAAAEKRGDVEAVSQRIERLRALITRQFDHALEEKRRQVKAVEVRLSEARGEIQSLAERREEVIADRVEDVLRRARAFADSSPRRARERRDENSRPD